jgi:hypothetical protein
MDARARNALRRELTDRKRALALEDDIPIHHELSDGFAASAEHPLGGVGGRKEAGGLHGLVFVVRISNNESWAKEKRSVKVDLDNRRARLTLSSSTLRMRLAVAALTLLLLRPLRYTRFWLVRVVQHR